MSTIVPETQLYLPAYSNHLTITTTCLPYYQRHNYIYPPTATTLQKHPPVYYTTRDTTVLSCQQQPPFNNIHLSTILPEIQLYFPVNSYHLTITPTCLPYYQTTTVLSCLQQPPYNNNHMSTILPETQLYFPVNSNHISITSICLPYYQRYDCTFLPTATTLQKHPPVYHTTRDTTVLTCLQQPPYNNTHLSTILPETQLYLSAYSNHLTKTPTCLLYYQRHNCTFLSTATTFQ